MTYVRVTRDQRGYETTFLLHSARPGAPARVLYWYRTAPGVRVGRAALDEDAIRSIEDQHPEIDFDWPKLLEEASTTPPDVERRPERRRRPGPPRDDTQAEPSAPEVLAPPPVGEPVFAAESTRVVADDSLAAAVPAEPRTPNATPRNPLLDQLVGREIASRLRQRYREISERIQAIAEGTEQRTGWQARADALDPDRWLSPQEILQGVEHADGLFDELRREVPETQ